MRELIDVRAVRDRLTWIALNLWWSWTHEAAALFRDLDPDQWQATNHNPVALLARLTDDDLARRVEHASLEGRANYVYTRLLEYLAANHTWCSGRAGVLQTAPVAYFSAEFGLHESLPLYSGGLGVLAGDYLKSASDLGLPAVGVGLFYARGYFTQRLDASGWQREEYGVSDVRTFPLVRAAAPDGSPLHVRVACGDEALHALVWLAHVGRARLLLLDSNVEVNPPHLRDLTASLYGGDQQTRLRQEILLGIGGQRALRALNIQPALLHVNEGHSAFAILERMRERVEHDGLRPEEALRETALRTVFTTHTPVDSGHDRFGSDLMERHLAWLRSALGLDQRRFMALGRVNERDDGEPFCMTVLGLKGARYRNGVSSLHGHVTRRMWKTVWPYRDEESVPIGHITNGVHALSWLAPAMKAVYDRYLGPAWVTRQTERATWHAVTDIDDGELWEVRSLLRRHLIEFARARSPQGRVLDPNALTIGFARRFASYKRATLLFTDLDRLAGICGGPGAPVQFVFAGKAHPRDDEGKRLMQQVIALTRDSRFRIVFLDDYDLNVGRHLVQGADVWLNTPLRPLEASGTSGQKAALNGALNLSSLDGWWAEACDGRNGFAFGRETTHADPGVQWNRDAASLYDVLEREVVPMFFDGGATGRPDRWIHAMKRSIATLSWRFNADRMVKDYIERLYLPAAGGVSCG